MRLVPALLSAALGLALGPGCAAPRIYGEGVALHTLFEGGVRAMEHEDLDGGAAYGLELATLEASSGWGYEAGWTLGSESVGGPRDLQAEFDEVHLGLRRTFVKAGRAARPYFGFGGVFTNLEREYDLPDAELTSEGGAAYLRGGCLWAVGHFQLERGNDLLLGLDLRGMLGEDYDALQLALVLGAGG